MTRPENEFPTIRDTRDVLQQLIDKGFGSLPTQLLVVPPSTLAVLAKDAGHVGPNPALMIETFASDGADIGVLIATVDSMVSGSIQ